MRSIRAGLVALGLAGATCTGALPPLVGSAAADMAPDHVIAYIDANPGPGVSGAYLHDLQAGETRHILTGVRAAMPAISPDGTRVAYSASGSDLDHAGHLQLWVAPTDGSSAPAELSSVYCSVQYPAWSADGQQIAYGCDGYVYVVDLTTGVLRGGFRGRSPSFSPDGSRLVVSGDSGMMSVIDLSGGGTAPVSLGRGSRPVWSPDGTEILYGSIESHRRLWAVRPDGTGQRLLAGATPSEHDSLDSWAWSADSRTIGFSGFLVDPVYNSRGPSDLWLIDRGGLRRWQVGETPQVHEASVSVSGSLHASVPASPTLAKASVGAGHAVVTWSPPSDHGGAPVNGYTVTANPGGATVSTTGDTTTVTVPGLTNGTAYTFTVTATNAVGTSLPSTRSAPVTPATRPDAPRIGTPVRGNVSAVVYWAAPPNTGGSPITGYVIRSYRGSTLVKTSTTAATARRLTVTGLTNSTTYTFNVSARNLAGIGTPSARSAAVTPIGGPPPPKIGTPRRGNASAVVYWAAPTNNGGAPITGYVIRTYRGSTLVKSSTAAATARRLTVTGLRNGARYTFNVSAKNALGIGTPSARSASVIPLA